MATTKKLATVSGSKPSTESADLTPDAPLLLSVPQTAALLNVSQGTVKNLLARRELVRRKVGARTLVPRTSIEAFLRKDHITETEEQKQLRRRKAAGQH
jgi:excisionase family DNA binding protein